MENEFLTQPQTSQARVQILVNSFIRSVYNWMAIGLALTGFVSFYIGHSQSMMRLIYGNPLSVFILIIAELGLVIYLSARIQRLEASTATALFLLYAALNGATLSFIFIVYSSTSIASTFFICAVTFVACSVYGFISRHDLTSMGGFMMMGLIGVIIASFINLFLPVFLRSAFGITYNPSAMTMIISYIGVIVFVGLTAYDTQKLKYMALTQPAGIESGVVRKGAILGALSLYLDFINLFLMLLRIFGNSRE